MLPFPAAYRSLLIQLLLVGASIGLFAVAMSYLDFQQARCAAAAATLLPWLPLASLCCLCGYVIRGMRCRKLVSVEAFLTLPAATNVVVFGYAVNNILPFRLGELARAWMLEEYTGLPFIQTLTVTFLERLLDGMAILGLFAIAIFITPIQHWALQALELGGWIFVIPAVATAIAVISPAYVFALVSRAANRVLPSRHDQIVSFVNLILNGLAYMRSSPGTLSVFGLTLLIWLMEAGMFLSMFPAFGISPSLRTAVLVMATMNMRILFTKSPGFIGPFQFFAMQALVATGVDRELALNYGILVHLAFFVPVTLWGISVLFMYGLTRGQNFVLSRSAAIFCSQEESAGIVTSRIARSRSLGYNRRAETPDNPTAFMMALVTAILPLDEYALAGAERQEAVRRIASFVDGQIRALPVAPYADISSRHGRFLHYYLVAVFAQVCGPVA